MKKAIIIGATSGLGKGLAEKLTAENYKVGITGRRVELLEKLKIQNSISQEWMSRAIFPVRHFSF